MTMTQLDAMALTFAIEAATAVLLAPVFSLPRLRCAASAILSSAVTHPILWAVFYKTQLVFGALNTPVLETFVFLAEAPVYRLLATKRWDDALLMSLLVNAASWGAGELIYALA